MKILIIALSALSVSCSESGRPFLGDYPVINQNIIATEIVDTSGFEIWKIEIDSIEYLLLNPMTSGAIIKHR